MRTVSLLAIVVAAAACGGGGTRTPAQPTSSEEHMSVAGEMERETSEQAQITTEVMAAAVAPEPYVCGDRAHANQLTSSDEPLLATLPCWNNEATVVEGHKAEAERLRAEAAVHKEMAQSLVNAEELACQGMSAGELTHTPFAHRADIVSVEEEREEGELRGARIVFAKVDGLTANWMRQAVACHHARAAALGYNQRFMSYDPTVLQYASTMVNETLEGGLEVKVISPDEEVAKLVYERASALVVVVQARR